MGRFRAASAGTASRQYLVQAQRWSRRPRRSRVMEMLGWSERRRTSALVVGPDGLGVEDGPVAGCSDISERWGWIDGEGAAGDPEHGGVVDGVAEDSVGVGDADAAEGCGLAFVGGDVDEVAGGDAVFDFGAGGEDAAGGNVEEFDAFFDDPVVGGADGPDFCSLLLEFGDEGAEFGEDLGLDVGAEVFGGGAAEFVFVEAGVDLDHFAADL